MRLVLCSLSFLFPCLLTAATQDGPLLHYDFESGQSRDRYPQLSAKDCEVTIVAGGADGKGHSLRFRNQKPGKYAQITLKGPFPLRKNLVLSFDHREEIETGTQASYFGILFFADKGKQWFAEDRFGTDWKHTEIELARLKSSNGGVLTLKTILERINLYGRANTGRGGPGATMTVWIDNIMLGAKTLPAKLSDELRVSTSNPPLFNWPHGKTSEENTLQYSTDPSFPEGKTTTVRVRTNFYTPPRPLTPGDWFWRVRTPTELTDNWSDTRRLRIVPEAHRFTTQPVPVAKIAAAPRPRVIDLDEARKEHAGKSRESLVKSAAKIHRSGVPADPPRYAPGNKDWPTWIDWYGKVHGGITSRTGRKLQQIAQLYALTRDAQVMAWTKEMAFAAAAWDPKGGSAMDAGDIGAQHLLRGLNWCYDALHDDLTADERGKLRSVIVARAEQFWKRLNPFRGSEANNHPWLNTLALAEAGMVLIGENDEAAAWAEYSRQLYLGRFLCCLGYQGDNNEGISYWGYGLGFVIDYADLMKHVCGIDLFQHPWLNQTGRFPMYSAPPGAWAVSFADTGKPNHGIKGPAQQQQVRDLAVRTRDPYALWYSGATNEVEGLLPKPPTDIPQSIHYRHIGWAIFNTSLVDGLENSTFAMRSGRFYAGHQHDDQNGFVIHAYGEKLAIDGGYYDWWGSPHFKAFSTRSRAHNTILVNGQDQAHMQKEADGRIATYFDSPRYSYTVGDASNPAVYQGQLKRFDRRALFIKPGFVVLHDILESAKAAARYDWLLHAVAPFNIDAATQSFSLDPVGADVRRRSSSVDASSNQSSLLTSAPKPRATLRGRFLSPAKISMAVTKGYPVEPVDGYSTRPVPPEKYAHEWTLTATPATDSVNQDFLTVMQIRRLQPSADPEARIESLRASNALAARVVSGNETHIIAFRTRDSQEAMFAGDLKCDGTAAAVEFSAKNKVRSVFAAASRELWFGKREIFSSDVPAEFSVQYEEHATVASISLGQPGRVTVADQSSAREMLVDGKSVNVEREPQSQRLMVKLAAGEHVVRIPVERH